MLLRTSEAIRRSQSEGHDCQRRIRLYLSLAPWVDNDLAIAVSMQWEDLKLCPITSKSCSDWDCLR
jgi:hypothetical protein